jgi:hypothetical protein
MMSVANEFGSIRDVNSGGGLPRMTCVACRVVFAKPDLHREHYKSDWHRYNLKRKVPIHLSLSHLFHSIV